MEVLIAHGAALDLQNAKGETALMLAAKYGRARACQLLVDAGADCGSKTNGGFTAADLATQGALTVVRGTTAGAPWSCCHAPDSSLRLCGAGVPELCCVS